MGILIHPFKDSYTGKVWKRSKYCAFCCLILPNISCMSDWSPVSCLWANNNYLVGAGLQPHWHIVIITCHTLSVFLIVTSTPATGALVSPAEHLHESWSDPFSPIYTHLSLLRFVLFVLKIIHLMVMVTLLCYSLISFLVVCETIWISPPAAEVVYSQCVASVWERNQLRRV